MNTDAVGSFNLLPVTYNCKLFVTGDAMPDFVLRGIEPDVAERIKTMARERSWAINDVILHLVKQGLGMGVQEENRAVPATAVPLRELTPRPITKWGNDDEDAVMRAAIEAFESLPVQAVRFS